MTGLRVWLLTFVVKWPGVWCSLSTNETVETVGRLRSSSAASSGYWDGQCSACPAYLYPWLHCKNGGRPQWGLSNSRPCPSSPVLCQARCSAPKPKPQEPRPVPGPKPTGPTGPSTYNDGLCTPCPAYVYKHCTKGGKLVGIKPCGWDNIYCEGVCTNPNPEPAPSPQPVEPVEPVVSEPGVKTLYHETSPDTAKKILASAFRPGTSGWCGGAIYFYTSPKIPDSKLGPDSQRGAIIQAEVDLGRNIRLDSKCDGAEQAREKYDSISFDPGDGVEYLVFSADRILSMMRYS